VAIAVGLLAPTVVLEVTLTGMTKRSRMPPERVLCKEGTFPVPAQRSTLLARVHKGFPHTLNNSYDSMAQSRIVVIRYAHQQMHTVRYTSYVSVRKLLHILATRCRSQGVTSTKECKH
jgi:hypothetical protein